MRVSCERNAHGGVWAARASGLYGPLVPTARRRRPRRGPGLARPRRGRVHPARV